MKVIHIEQLDDGVQKKPYADHIFHWHLVVEEADKDDLLSFCRGNLKDAKREHDDYFKQYRQKDIDFDSMMKIVCGGWYQLRDNNDGTFDYIVHYEYID